MQLRLWRDGRVLMDQNHGPTERARRNSRKPVPAIPPPLLLTICILATALAQILLKRASFYEIRTTAWFVFMALSAGSYVLSFIAYSQMLRFYALNKAYPLTTVAQILLVTIYGLAIGEAIGLRHALGLVLGGAAIYLILS